MGDVIAIGRRAGPFLADPVHVVHVDPDDVLHDLAAMYDMVKYHADRDRHLLVLFPQRLRDQLESSLRTVRSMLGRHAVLLHATPLPPLAADVLVTLLAAIRPQLPNIAMVSAALSMIEQQILHLTWLSSVSGLSHPVPTVGQHARSVLPGGSWMVRSWPELRIERFDPTTTVEVPSASQMVGVALADSGGDRSWIDPMIGAHIAQPVSVEVEPSSDVPTWWGCDRVTQLVLYPRDVDGLVGALRRFLDIGRCRWCGETVGAVTCPWCRLPRGGLPLGQHLATATVDDGPMTSAEPTSPAARPAQRMERTRG